MTANEILARIWVQYLDNNLDECRPEWGKRREEDLKTQLFCGRGGGCLLTLQDCKDAFDRTFLGQLDNSNEKTLGRGYNRTLAAEATKEPDEIDAAKSE